MVAIERVAYVAFEPFPNAKGSGTRIGQMLRALVGSGREVVLLTLPGRGAGELPPGVEHRALPVFRGNFLERALAFRHRVARELHALRPHAIHFRGIFEGQAAMALETLARRAGKARRVYQFESDERGIIDPAILWQALLSDLQSGRAIEDIAAAFHAGLAAAVVDMAGRLCGEHRLSIVALSGGVFQNRILFETVCQGLRGIGLCVLSHAQVPCNDGGLSLGQAAVAAAKYRLALSGS